MKGRATGKKCRRSMANDVDAREGEDESEREKRKRVPK
jgi:hypothetical protein